MGGVSVTVKREVVQRQQRLIFFSGGALRRGWGCETLAAGGVQHASRPRGGDVFGPLRTNVRAAFSRVMMHAYVHVPVAVASSFLGACSPSAACASPAKGT